MITFTIPGLPVAQPRQRSRVMAAGGRFISQNYTPADSPVQSFKAAVRMAAAAAYCGEPLAGPLSVTLRFIFPRPKGLMFRSKPMPRVPRQGKPDIDNLLKSVADALNGLLWRDDAQIVGAFVTKWIAAGGEQPRTEVQVEAVT